MTQAQLAAIHRRLQALIDERRDAFEQLTASDAMLGLVHDINNRLNDMMLQASILEMKVDEALREEVSEIRRLGHEVAGRLALVQQFRDRSRNERVRVDLIQIVRDVLTAHPELAVSLQNDSSDRPLLLLVDVHALNRLILLLVSVVALGGVPVRARTLRRGEEICLVIEPASADSDAPPSEWAPVPAEEDGLVPVMQRLAAEAVARLVGAELQAQASDRRTTCR